MAWPYWVLAHLNGCNMAKRKKSSNRSGSTWFGLILGMVLGVAAAVAVALFVTQAPMPFKDKASRSIPNTILPDVNNAPDPNIALYGQNGPAGTRSSAQGGSAIAIPPIDSAKKPADPINDIIASIESPKLPEQTPPPLPKPPAVKPSAATQTIYYLQTGAFRSDKDAQDMMARVTLLGLDVRVEKGTSNGEPINRVRVGPFKGIDEMNRARSILGQEQIESAVVRP